MLPYGTMEGQAIMIERHIGILEQAASTMASSSEQAREETQTRASVFLRLKETDPVPRELAWQAFYDRYAPLIAGYARSKGATPQQADEIVQDVMLGFFSASPRFVYNPAAGRFRGYLRVCVGRALKRLRDADRSGRLPSVSLDDIDIPDAKADDPADVGLWDELWERERLGRILAEAREHYHRKGRTETFLAFERNVLFGEPAAMVAQELGMSPASVHVAKMRVTRRLAALKTRLIEEEG